MNLGQGFPDTDGPPEIIDAVATAMRSGANQYPPRHGVPELRAEIADHQRRRYGLELDAEAGIQVTFGATEAIAATMLGLLEPGDGVVVLEPFYDSYAATIAMAGGERRPVTLRPPDFAVDLDALAAAAAGARMLLLNSPHNPTGRVLHATSCRRSPTSASSTISSPSPTRSTSTSSSRASTSRWRRSGHGRADADDLQRRQVVLLHGLEDRLVHRPAAARRRGERGKAVPQFSGGTPLQHGVAAALADAERHVAPLQASLRASRDSLCAGLRARASASACRRARTS